MSLHFMSHTGILQHWEVSCPLHVRFGKRPRWGATSEPFLAGPQGWPVGFQLCLRAPGLVSWLWPFLPSLLALGPSALALPT